MNEKKILEKYFVPLSLNFRGSFFLKDDAALLKNYNGKEYTISVDNFIHGVHCPLNMTPKFAIKRAVLTATSDLSAMAATPYCMFLSLSLPKKISTIKIKEIALGLKNALEVTNLKLGGGDLCSYNGPLTYNITVVGKVYKNQILKRESAKIGDLLLVTGSIGEASVGLNCLLNTSTRFLDNKEKKIAIQSFLVPPILYKFSIASRKYIRGCIDISDGLIEDVGKVALYSNCGVKIHSELIPFTKIVKKILKKQKSSLIKLISAGDDYELAFAASKKEVKKIKKLALKYNTKVTVIGEFIEKNGVFLDNKKVEGGYSHL